ncbi:hypothetical protein CYY_002044 [Polysphondylium violaceum]|uniref:RidA family protein n=1 Tax=Polysphondylium violaceum TaxID=133409 RepID=A0A8J4Q2A1_9MYCE|nr:hypothetical protein CYY_002044 [Polysphondylium violaceum]
MNIVRIQPEARWSEAVIHNNTLYFTGVPDNLDADVYEQSVNVLQQIESMLVSQGSNKRNLIDVTIFLSKLEDFNEMNRAWDSWVIPGHCPVRCTVEARLMNPKFKVEMKFVAAVFIPSMENSL